MSRPPTSAPWCAHIGDHQHGDALLAGDDVTAVTRRHLTWLDEHNWDVAVTPEVIAVRHGNTDMRLAVPISECGTIERTVAALYRLAVREELQDRLADPTILVGAVAELAMLDKLRRLRDAPQTLGEATELADKILAAVATSDFAPRVSGNDLIGALVECAMFLADQAYDLSALNTVDALAAMNDRIAMDHLDPTLRETAARMLKGAQA